MALVTINDVREAEERIRGYVHRTPVMTCSKLDALSGHKLFFKCELFQKTGSFKVRGATNMILKHFPSGSDLTGASIVTHSCGNHAQGVALAGRLCGVPAHIVMPETSPAAKSDAVRGYGGKVIFCADSQEARIKCADEVLAKLGSRAMMVPSSQNPAVIAGQGTIATELMEQVPDLDVLVGSVSGGGLVAGLCIGAKAIKPGIKIVAAEPKNADDTAQSFAAGRIVKPKSPPKTVADALKVTIGDLAWPILHDNISGVVSVTEEEIISTTKLVWERMKLVVEPSAAVSVAAVLNPQFQKLVGPGSMRIGIILCGGNVDLDHLPWMKSTM